MYMELFETRDRNVVPFLLTQKQVDLVGSRLVGNTIYFQFTPKDICEDLVNAFVMRKAPLIQPKDLLDAVDVFKNMVFELKEKNDVDR